MSDKTKDQVKEVFDGTEVDEDYELVESEFTFAQLNLQGEFILGNYEGIEQIKTPDGMADYMMIHTKTAGIKAVSINPSLRRAVTKLNIGDDIKVILYEIGEPKGTKQGFKRYRIYKRRH